MFYKHLSIFLFIEEKKLTLIGQQVKAELREEQSVHNRFILPSVILFSVLASGVVIIITLRYASTFQCLVPIVGLFIVPLIFGSLPAVEIPFLKKMQDRKLLWLSTYGTEVFATLTERKKDPSAEVDANRSRFTWVHPLQEEPLSCWEIEDKLVYQIGGKYKIRYDPTDLSFHYVDGPYMSR